MAHTRDMEKKRLLEWFLPHWNNFKDDKRPGRTVVALAKAMKMGRYGPPKIANGQRTLKYHEAVLAANFWGIDHPPPPGGPIPRSRLGAKLAKYISKIEAGAWRDEMLQSIATKEEIKVYPQERYADLEQFYFDIEDDSCNLLAGEGARIHTVKYGETRKSLQVNDNVVVKKYHPLSFANGGKPSAEWTVRRVIRKKGKLILAGLSSVHGKVADIQYNPSDELIEVAYLIIGVDFGY